MIIIGGSYYKLTTSYQQNRGEYGFKALDAHHLYGWASYRDVLNLTRGEGPSILMDRADHQALKSTDHNPGSVEHREKQQNFLEQRRFGEAWKMDIDDIRSKFGTKYDEHLVQAESYLLKLDEAKKIQLEREFKVELEQRQVIQKDLAAKRVEFEKAAKYAQEQKATELKELEGKRAESFEKELVVQKEFFRRRELHLSNEAGEMKTLFYRFTPSEALPELTQEVKQELWKLPEKSTITSKTIEAYQQQVALAQQRLQQSQGYSHGLY